MNENPNQNQNQNSNTNQNAGQNGNFGKKIGDSVRNAVETGDMNHLSGIGPAVQDAVQKGLGAAGQAMQNAAGQMQGQQGRQQGHPYAQQGTGQQQNTRPAWQGGAAHTYGSAPQGAQQAYPPQKPRRQKQRHYYGMLGLVLGIVGTCLFAAVAFLFGVLGLAVPALLPVALGLLVPLVASIVVLGVGITRRALAGRAQKYYDLLGEKNVRTIEDLSEYSRKPIARVRKDAKRMIEHELYPDLWMDAQGTCLIRGEEAYRLYTDSERSRRERELEEAERRRRMDDPATAGIEAFRQEGVEALKKMRAAKDATRGEVIKEKLAKLEVTTGKIFAYVEKHPEKLPDTRKFMSYYLPTTLKLVEKYRHFEEMDVQLDNVVKTKGEIERSMDTIDTAFNNLLGSLYQEDTMDVTTDIEVLQAMLEQEGLMGKKFDIEGEGQH